MQAVALTLPDSLDDDAFLRLPATWDEYLSVSETAPYITQFLHDEIIMSQASADHETLVGILIWLFNTIYFERDDYRVMGSNVVITLPDGKGDFNADVSVVKEPVAYGRTPGGKPSTMRVQNPEIVVEVSSNSTRTFDLGEKLSYYKLIPSLQHILFVEQTRPYATVYTRTDVPDEWLNYDYRTLGATVRLGTLELPMAAIYRKTNFDTPPTA